MNQTNEQTAVNAVPLIYGKIAEVMANLTAISKDRTNAQQKFKFRGIDDVMNTLHSVLAKAGVFIVPNVLHEERSERKSIKADYNGNQRESILFYTRLTIEFTFYASDGSNIKSVVIGEAMDSGDKASNKALSIAYKYACLQVFCIPTEEDKDPDAVSHNVAPQQPTQPFVQNNRVNYQRQPQQAPQQQYRATVQPEHRYNPDHVPAPVERAVDVFAGMQKASEIKTPAQSQAPQMPPIEELPF